MSTLPRSALWLIRDNRSLSAYAKLAYYTLWLRGADAHPSMATLGADMGCSARTARTAVRDLESAGLLRTIRRVTKQGDADSNRYELLEMKGAAEDAEPFGTDCRTGTAPPAAKDRTMKQENEGRKSQASRRAQPAAERDDMIRFVRKAVAISYSTAEAEELTDGQAVALWYLLVSNRTPKDPVAYLCKPFGETPYLDTHLANAGTEEDWE